jgi:AcrR family transcriptional regulator
MEASSMAEAARRSGVARSTLYGWLREPAFARKLEALRSAEDRLRLNALRALVPEAFETLQELLRAGDERVRLRAACEVLKSYQALSAKEEAAHGVEEEVLEGGDLTGLAEKSVRWLLNGSLSPRVAQMLPSYLRLLERPGGDARGKDSEDDEFDKFLEEYTPDAMADFLAKPLEFDPTGDPLLTAYQATIKEMIKEAGGDVEQLEREMEEAHAAQRKMKGMD